MPISARHAHAMLAALLIILADAIGAHASGPRPLDPMVTIKVNAPGVVGLAPLYLGLEKGYFAAEGLDVELATGVATKGGMEIVTALCDGRLDIATIAPSAGLFNALAGGARLKGLFVLNTVMPSDRSSGIVVRQDLIDSGRYTAARDLAGMKIAVGAIGSTAQYNVVKALAQARVATDRVEFVTMPFPEALAALGRSAIDAAFEVEPFISIGEAQRIAHLVIPSSETSPGAASILVFGNADFVARNPAGVERYVYALLRGQRDYAALVKAGTGKEELYTALMKYTALKDSVLLKEINLPTVDPGGALDARAMEDLQNFFVEGGGLQKTLSSSQIIDMHFTAEAMRRLGAAP